MNLTTICSLPEQNIRRMQFKERDCDCLFKIMVDTVRLNLIGLNVKFSPDVVKAASIWNFPVSKAANYSSLEDEINIEDISL
ncbi:hypothetical protein CTI12_AA268970 [Artemisia annua]|uniref:Uncharacterized protein n=1 Tax=Artemisia annua TaxID=35608 RepID=A0A2U1NGF8_ARTAN|nr:hypothetical protein CTI12_AA268970 [Artemisia annua]